VSVNDSVVWHELECGSYRADLALWLALAERQGGPVLDVGAGTGRVALTLARAGHAVTALDLDTRLLQELERRADLLAARFVLSRELVAPIAADAREFSLPAAYPLIIVPMQTLQLLGGAAGRRAFLLRAAAHLRHGGLLAAAVATALEPFDVRDGVPAPSPDTTVRHGLLYSSQPTAIRSDGEGYVLERRREKVMSDGKRRHSLDTVRIDRVEVRALRDEARSADLRLVGVERIAETEEHVASDVVMFNGS
jgi:SAM-dependent methyltransferase